MNVLELDLDIWNIGEEFINAPHHHFSTTESAVIRAFVEDRWQADIRANGINVRWVNYQPYRSAKEMKAALQATGELAISTLGNVKDNDLHPLSSKHNLLHRAVHDYHHCLLLAGFNVPGELTASAHMLKLARDTGYPMFVQQFLLSDMVGQLGHFYATGGEYAGQKVVLFAPELVDELVCLYEELGAAGMIARITPFDKAARERHGWRTQSAH